MLREEQTEKAPWQLIVQDVPVVIFIAMLCTGTLAGVIGAGIPILINYISLKTKKHLGKLLQSFINHIRKLIL
jgi:hypothetical protein